MGTYHYILECEKVNKELKKDIEYYKSQNRRLKEKVNQLESDVDSYKNKYKRANELYLDNSKKINQLETNRDEVKEEIKDLLEHWKGNDLVERDLNILLTILDKVGGSNE